MAEEQEKSERTLEMRVAELEDKLAQVHITEDELKAFHKVSALLGGAGAPTAAGAAAVSQGSVAAGCVVDCQACINECGVVIRPCIVRQCIRFCVIGGPIIQQCIIQQCIIQQCINECAPGLPGVGGVTGFGQLGG